jgi:DNA-binding transcriptional LysR family regulator
MRVGEPSQPWRTRRPPACSLARHHLIDREIRHGRLVQPLAAEVPPGQGFYLVIAKGRVMSDGMRVFCDRVMTRS